MSASSLGHTAASTPSRDSGAERCFICQDESPGDTFQACPCSLRVHRTCLNHWIASLPLHGSDHAPKCPQCQALYSFDERWSPVLTIIRRIERSLDRGAAYGLATTFRPLNGAIAGLRRAKAAAKEGSDVLGHLAYTAELLANFHIGTVSAFALELYWRFALKAFFSTRGLPRNRPLLECISTFIMPGLVFDHAHLFAAFLSNIVPGLLMGQIPFVVIDIVSQTRRHLQRPVDRQMWYQRDRVRSAAVCYVLVAWLVGRQAYRQLRSRLRSRLLATPPDPDGEPTLPTYVTRDPRPGVSGPAFELVTDHHRQPLAVFWLSRPTTAQWSGLDLVIAARTVLSVLSWPFVGAYVGKRVVRGRVTAIGALGSRAHARLTTHARTLFGGAATSTSSRSVDDHARARRGAVAGPSLPAWAQSVVGCLLVVIAKDSYLLLRDLLMRQHFESIQIKAFDRRLTGEIAGARE